MLRKGYFRIACYIVKAQLPAFTPKKRFSDLMEFAALFSKMKDVGLQMIVIS